MEDNSKRIDELFKKLDLVLQQQENFSKEVADLRAEITELRYGRHAVTPTEKLDYDPDELVPSVVAPPPPT